MASASCSKCHRVHYARELCRKHYRESRHGLEIQQQKARRRAVYDSLGDAERRATHRRDKGMPEPTRAEPMYCECCGKRAKMCLDHDHLTHDFRGWLCDKCNRGIGALDDTLNGVLKAAAYLQRYLENRKWASKTHAQGRTHKQVKRPPPR